MTDSPNLVGSLDPQEQAIHDALLELRDQLTLLKQDKSTYIKSQDVLRLYEEVNDQVHQLNNISIVQKKKTGQSRGWSPSSHSVSLSRYMFT